LLRLTLLLGKLQANHSLEFGRSANRLTPTNGGYISRYLDWGYEQSPRKSPPP
jgi:hypothetical protein